jgi:transposase
LRVSTAFNKLLRLQGTSVTGVTFGAEGMMVAVRLRRRRSRCSGCARRAPIHDRSTRRWRHLDLGAQRCYLEAEIRRVRCAECGVKVEAVTFARPGARHSRDLEDVVAFLAQQTNKTMIAKLLRIDWATVGRIVERVVADHVDETRLAGLVMIGVDEVSWRKRHRYLTCVADHMDGGVIWTREGRSAATLGEFFEELGEEKVTIQAVSIDMSAGYEKAVRGAIPQAQIAFNPFHVVKLAGEAVDKVRRAEWNEKGKSKTGSARWVKGTRWALLKASENRTAKQDIALAEVQSANKRLYRAFLLKEELRALYHDVTAENADAHLDGWLAWAQRSKLKPFVKLARTIREHRDGVIAAVRLGLSNGRLEGLNSKVRLISHRSFGFHSASPLIALIYLCLGGSRSISPSHESEKPNHGKSWRPRKKPPPRPRRGLLHQTVVASPELSLASLACCSRNRVTGARHRRCKYRREFRGVFAEFQALHGEFWREHLCSATPFIVLL